MTLRHLLRHTAAAAAVLSLSAGLAACGSSSSGSGSGSGGGGGSAGASAAAQPTTATTTATVAADTNTNLPPLIVGDQAGTGAQALLDAAGLLHKLPFTVKFADFTSGPPILEAMNAGSVDIGGVGNAPPVFAAAGGAKIKIVGALQNSTSHNAALVVPKGSSIKTLADLKGKKIAVAEGSSADYHLLATLTKAGLTTKDVQLDYLQPAEGLAALESGAVDAWDIWSPFIEQVTITKGARILIGKPNNAGDYSYEVASDAAVSDPTKSKEIKQYLQVLNQAHVWANTHPGAWAKTWAAATGLPDNVMLKAAADDKQTPVPVNSAIAQSEQTLVTQFSKAGLIPKSYSFSTYVSPNYNSVVK
jgi:sulfonate transport system substrate-binding protein